MHTHYLRERVEKAGTKGKIRQMAACGQWPNVFVLGAQKAATSSLCSWMSVAGASVGTEQCCPQHWTHCNSSPEEFGETHFLSQCSKADACTRYHLLFEQSSSGVSLDCTPNFLSDPGASKLLESTLPSRLHANVCCACAPVMKDTPRPCWLWRACSLLSNLVAHSDCSSSLGAVHHQPQRASRPVRSVSRNFTVVYCNREAHILCPRAESGR